MLTDTEAARDTTWVVDPESSSVGFTIAHFRVATVRGSFGTFAATLADNRGVLHADGAVDPATVDTGNPLRDRSLRRAEFFDIDRHPEIRFTSSQIQRLPTGGLRITGKLRSGLFGGRSRAPVGRRAHSRDVHA
jgi:polyisoprenoid-binding protein YceI